MTNIRRRIAFTKISRPAKSKARDHSNQMCSFRSHQPDVTLLRCWCDWLKHQRDVSDLRTFRTRANGHLIWNAFHTVDRRTNKLCTRISSQTMRNVAVRKQKQHTHTLTHICLANRDASNVSSNDKCIRFVIRSYCSKKNNKRTSYGNKCEYIFVCLIRMHTTRSSC